LELKNRFEDERYLLISASWDGNQFIYLKDKVQKTESLGIPSKPLDVETFWKKHKEGRDYCLPCELLLYFEKKVMVAENSVVEWGITLERLKKFREFIEKNN
jgi:hypothetical protein